MALELTMQLVINGLLKGAVLALAALGLTLIFGVMDIVNFAHGTYVMLAMYASHVAWAYFGIGPFLAVLLIAPAFFLFGMASHYLVIRPIIDYPMYAQVFATLGMLWAFENTALFLFGAEPASVGIRYGGIAVGSVAMQRARLYGFVVAVIVTAILFFILYRTKTGLAIRATAQSRNLAQPYGVDIDRIFLLTFGLGIAIVGVAGSVIMSTRSVVPSAGNYYVLISFVIVTLGGLGSVSGALAAGLFIGVADSFIGFYLSPSLGPPIYFVLFISVLVLRTTGSFEELRYRVRSLIQRDPDGGVVNH